MIINNKTQWKLYYEKKINTNFQTNMQLSIYRNSSSNSINYLRYKHFQISFLYVLNVICRCNYNAL